MLHFGAMDTSCVKGIPNTRLSAGVLRVLLADRVTVDPRMSKAALVSLATLVWGPSVSASTAASGERKLRGSRSRDLSGDEVSGEDVLASMVKASAKHRGTGRDAMLAVPFDFRSLRWTHEWISLRDDKLAGVEAWSRADVRRYARRMLVSSPPPVILVDREDHYECVDGAHRIDAAREAEMESIEAYVGHVGRRRRR